MIIGKVLRDSVRSMVKAGLSLVYTNNDGIYVTDEDWDVLIILDACRYDFFKRYNILDGKLEKRISRGTSTPNFLEENFKGKHFDDIVYVTGNPFVDLLVRDSFYKVIPVWKVAWNNKFNTVLPKDMSKFAWYTIKKYPDKRIIVHYMQPHYPYLKYTHKEAWKELSMKELRNGALKGVRTSGKLPVRIFPPAIYGAPIYKDYPVKKQIDGYTDNLKIVLTEVKKLIDNIDGKKIVISADHGESFGNFMHPLIPIRVYGHVGRIRSSVLKTVPWFIIDKRGGK